jgi:hypothetical protein
MVLLHAQALLDRCSRRKSGHLKCDIGIFTLSTLVSPLLEEILFRGLLLKECSLPAMVGRQSAYFVVV